MPHGFRVAVGVFVVFFALPIRAVPPTPERMQELCAQVEGPSHCGRVVEAEQLKSLPSLAVRDGDTLKVSLFPSGTRDFVDTISSSNEHTFALWDYWSPVNAVVLFTTAGDELGYAVLQRTTGQLTVLPAEPLLAPDRQRVATADFCPTRCTGEITVWRMSREGLRRELGWKPPAGWSDVTVAWKDADTLTIQYTAPGEEKSRTQERKLAATDWKKF